MCPTLLIHIFDFIEKFEKMHKLFENEWGLSLKRSDTETRKWIKIMPCRIRGPMISTTINTTKQDKQNEQKQKNFNYAENSISTFKMLRN